MEYRAATWRTRRLAAEPCPLWSIGPFAINVLPLKAQVKDRVTRSPTPHHPLKFEITFCVRGVYAAPWGAGKANERGQVVRREAGVQRQSGRTGSHGVRLRFAGWLSNPGSCGGNGSLCR